MATLKDLSAWSQDRLLTALKMGLPVFPQKIREKYYMSGQIENIPPCDFNSCLSMIITFLSFDLDKPKISPKVLGLTSMALASYVKEGVITPAYGDLYELATALAKMKQSKEYVFKIDISFDIKKRSDLEQEENDKEKPSC